MNLLLFFQIFVAVMLGNLFTLLLIYSFYRVTKAEQGGDPPRFLWLLGIALPGIFLVFGAKVIFTG